MKHKVLYIFQIAAVFIGTIVGAGLASGQEINQFFSTYGWKSFIGIGFCCAIYIYVGYLVIQISLKYNLSSYKELICLVSPGFLGNVIDIIMSFFLISSSAIILAGSGALLHQYFGAPRFIGIIIMVLASLIILFRDTQGLIEINSFIVPALITVIITIFLLFIFFNKNIATLDILKSIPTTKKNWALSSILYAGFNILSCSGVLVPLSKEVKNKKVLIWSLTIGSIVLTILCCMINFMLILSIANISKYEIPLLYISNGFGAVIQIILLCIIWLEMFSTEVSDIFSVAKTMESSLKIPYRKSVIIIVFISLPISQIGFKNLISFLYPGFGLISILFMFQAAFFYYKNCKN